MTDYINWTLVHQVREQAAALGEQEWMTFGSGAPALTYAAFDRRSDAVAAALTARGVGEDDRVMMLVKNRAEFLIAMIGIMKCGAIFVPINTELRGTFLQHQLRNCEPHTVICDASLLNAFDNVDAGEASPRHLIIVAGDPPSAPPPALAAAKVEAWEAFRGLRSWPDATGLRADQGHHRRHHVHQRHHRAGQRRAAAAWSHVPVRRRLQRRDGADGGGCLLRLHADLSTSTACSSR